MPIVTRRASLLCAVLLVFATSCGAFGGGSSNGGSADYTQYRQNLREFNTEYLNAVTAHDKVLQAWIDWSKAYVMADTAAEDAAFDRAMGALPELESTSTRLVELEHALHDATLQPGQQALDPFTLASVGIAVYSLYQLAQWLRKQSDDVSAARKQRDDALGHVAANDDPNAEQHAMAAQKQMNDIGAKVSEELATRVTSELLLTPVDPTTVAGLVIKDRAGNALQDGLKAIAATPSCQTKFDDPNCRISIDTTKNGGTVTVPAPGPVDVVVAGGTNARIGVAQTTVMPGSTIEVTRETIPIDSATPKNVSENDDGTYVPNNTGSNNTTPTNNTTTTNNTPTNNKPMNNPTTGQGDTYPATPFSGLQIQYMIQGAQLDTPSDSTDASSSTRTYQMGKISSSTVIVSGTITSTNTHAGTGDTTPPYAQIAVSLSNGVDNPTFMATSDTTGTWTKDFSVQVDASSAQYIQFQIAGYFNDGTANDATVSIGGTLVP